MYDVEARELDSVQGGIGFFAAIGAAYILTCIGIGIYEGITSSSTSVGDRWCN